MAATEGAPIRGLDGNWAFDLAGSYGVNVFGYDFYKACVDRGIDRVRALAPVLGPHHPVMLKNVQWLKETSGMDGASHVQFEHVEPRQPDSRFECERRSVMGSAPGTAPSGANSPCSQTTLAGRASST